MLNASSTLLKLNSMAGHQSLTETNESLDFTKKNILKVRDKLQQELQQVSKQLLINQSMIVQSSLLVNPIYKKTPDFTGSP
jgi:hypothetical protein